MDLNEAMTHGESHTYNIVENFKWTKGHNWIVIYIAAIFC